MYDVERLHCATTIIVAYLSRSTVEVDKSWITVKAAMDSIRRSET